MNALNLILIFLVVFLIMNYLMSYLGLFPKLANAYKTNREITTDEKSKISELELSRTDDFENSRLEYRGWLNVYLLKEGLYVEQRPVLNFFPRKMMIPWKNIKEYTKLNRFLRERFVYSVEYEGSYIYIFSKKELKREKGSPIN